MACKLPSQLLTHWNLPATSIRYKRHGLGPLTKRFQIALERIMASFMTRKRRAAYSLSYARMWLACEANLKVEVRILVGRNSYKESSGQTIGHL